MLVFHMGIQAKFADSDHCYEVTAIKTNITHSHSQKQTLYSTVKVR